MLSAEDLEKLLDADGEEIEQIDLGKCRVGDIFRAQTTRGDAYFIQITVAISHRADVYRYDGKEYSLKNAFLGNFHFSVPIDLYGFSYGNNYSFNVRKLQKVHLG